MAKEKDILEDIERAFAFPGNSELLTGPGDDCAVLAPMKGRLVITTDEQVEGTHFLPGSEPEDIACRLMRSNISDLAGMGYVRPVSCVAGAGLVPDLPEDFVRRFISGLRKEAEHFGITVAGGNLAGARECHFYLTVWGEALAEPILRNTAKPGDLLAEIGPMGEAKAALEILIRKNSAEMNGYAGLIENFWRPVPQLEAGRILAQNGIASAMLDNSDGLYKSAAIIAERSGLKAVINAKDVQPSEILSKWCDANGKNAAAYAIDGGEDYGLVFAVRPEKADLLRKMLPQAQVIGHFETGTGIILQNFQGKIDGFEHF